MQAMVRAGLKRVSWKGEGFEVSLEREGERAEGTPLIMASHGSGVPHVMPVAPAPLPTAGPVAAPQAGGEGRYITSPMVGTFYAAASPQDAPFVKAGDRVEKETPVCIIEAMKVMNEVKAMTEGVVAEVLLKNGDPVEFGTKLFRVT